MDTEGQQLKLRWNRHKETLVEVFGRLLRKGAHVDCTLAAEGRQIHAHKLILSACSSYLCEILVSHKDRHPILIFNDIRFKDLEAMVDYMYKGEVNVSNDELETFLKAAELLQLSGLTRRSESEEPVTKKSRLKHTVVKNRESDLKYVNKPNENNSSQVLLNGNELQAAPLLELENFERNFKVKLEKRSNLMNITNTSSEEDKSAGPSEYSCEKCYEKFNNEPELNFHIVNQCTLYRPYKCEQCGKTYSHKRWLLSHMAKECGKSQQFLCPYCPQISALRSNLNSHVKKMHSVVYDAFMSSTSSASIN